MCTLELSKMLNVKKWPWCFLTLLVGGVSSRATLLNSHISCRHMKLSGWSSVAVIVE